MNARFLYTALLSTALLLTGPSVADSNSHREQVEILFKLTQMEQKINESVESLAQLQMRQNPEFQAKRDILIAFLEKHIGWNATRSDLTSRYMQTFTEQELKAMNDFYITPTGQKVITIVPQLVQQRNRLAMQQLQQHAGELQEILSTEQAP